MKILSNVAVLLFLITSTNLKAAAPYCGEIKTGGAGGDYTKAEDRERLKIVEEHHFTSNIENLSHGNSGELGGELSYTLMMSHNHHRVLAAFNKLSVREKTLKPLGAKYSVECFFDRAMRFKPDDGVVRMLYGDYLLKSGQSDKATEQFLIAVNLQPDHPTINYNLGLLYMKKKDYVQAKTYAKKAYEMGFPLPGLKNQLIQAGKWED